MGFSSMGRDFYMHHLNETAGTLTLMGSGEMSPGMAETHRRIMQLIEGDVRPVFIDTPAGFELNVSTICEKAVAYFRDHFALDLAIASFPSAARATPLITEAALSKVRSANYIFSGPGSPTYAVRNWRGTPVFEAMTGKLASGAHLVMASAATLALGRFTIPVYEIYKVGEEPYWVDGIDLLGRYGLNLAIVPHWNNNSGGGGEHDTRRCFIGASRFDELWASLPLSATVLGIDEYTACVLALKEQTCTVYGSGTVTVQRKDSGGNTGSLRVFGAGEQFGFDVLQDSSGVDLARQPSASPLSPLTAAIDDTLSATVRAFHQTLYDQQPASAVGYVHSLIEHARLTGESSRDADQRQRVQLAAREMLVELAIWLERSQGAAQGTMSGALAEDALVGKLVHIVIAQRAALRERKEYAQADQLRAALLAAGIELKDTPQGTDWARV